MLPLSANTLKRALLVLAWPLTEILILRVYLHAVLELHFGFVNVTDYDFLLPGPVGFIILLNVLESGAALRLRAQKIPLLTNLFAFALFLVLNHHIDFFSAISPWLTVSVWFALVSLIVASGLCVWVAPTYYFRNPNRFAFLPCLLIAASLYFYTYTFHEGWTWLGSLTSICLVKFFAWFPGTHITSAFTPEANLRLLHPAFKVSIGKPCGGFDSLFFFSLVFLLVVTLSARTKCVSRWMAGYLGGLVLMFGLNLFRIILLFLLGIWLQQVMPHKMAINLFKLCFHANLGWILYAAGIFSYLRFLAREPKRQTTKHLEKIVVAKDVVQV